MRNEFMLHVVREHGDVQLHEEVKKILSKKELNALLIYAKKINRGKEIFYKLAISPKNLVKLKKILDKSLKYKSVDLFVFKEW